MGTFLCRKYLYNVLFEIDNFLQISITDNFFSLYNVSAAHAVASDVCDNPLGLPPRRPRARAALNPACVRSRMTSRSNSAREAKILKINRPCDVVVSMVPVTYAPESLMVYEHKFNMLRLFITN